MLLHVIEASSPVDLAAHGIADRVARQWRGEDVRDTLILVDDVATCAPPSEPRSYGWPPDVG